MLKKLFILAFITAAAVLPSAASASETMACDVAVVGAGAGGCAAAIQAARMGMTVLLLEPSDWVGGQMTAAAVSTMDDKTFTRTGLYLEFISKIREDYKRIGKNTNTCYWGGDTIAFEPAEGKRVLLDMINKTGRVKVIYDAHPVSAKVAGGTVKSAVFSIGSEKLEILAKIFIDATECGDFIPLTGARYRAGNGISPHVGKAGIIQDTTYVAVVKRYPNGLPEELKVNNEPPHYEEYVDEFRSIVTKNGNTWPGDYPFDVPSHNAYRALPDPESKENIDGGHPNTWKNATKTCINWANDWPGGQYNGRPKSLSVRYLTDAKYRLNADRRAIGKTLAFIYYMQHELGLEDWSVDDSQGFSGSSVSSWQTWEDMPEEYAPILQHFPPVVYVRESRRIAGVKTMVVKDIIRDQSLHRTQKVIPDAIALGEYPIDIHGLRNTRFLDQDLGEKEEDIPNDWQGEGGLFQIPFGALIPEKINGLLAAEKNISVSRVVNGSIRLQPVTMLTGQAAGAIAAIAVKQKTEPRNVRLTDVQTALLESKDKLSVYRFKDVSPEVKLWAAVEFATVRGYLEPASETMFQPDNDIHWLDVIEAFRRLLGTKDLPERDMLGTVTENDLALWLQDISISRKLQIAAVISDLAENGDKPLKKARFAEMLYEIAKRVPEPKAAE